jgi:hypothetical protein
MYSNSMEYLSDDESRLNFFLLIIVLLSVVKKY